MFAHLPDTIVAVRHPQCLHNVDYDGAIKTIANRDSPLTALGEQQKVITAEYLREEFGHFDRVFSSGYLRTHAIPASAEYPFVVEELLNERDQGLMHKLGPKEFFSTYPAEQAKLNKSYYHYQAPAGETCPDVEMRLLAFFSHESRFRGLNLALISGHGITGRCARKVLTNASEEDWHAYGGLANGSVTVYQKTGDWFECTLYNHIPWRGLLDDGRGVEA
jgi:broad specificity phosphatase PhoE